MPRVKRLPHKVKEGIEEVTAYLLSDSRPVRHALGLAETIREYGATPERLSLLYDALEQVAESDERALEHLRELRSYGERR